jgi:hypothetical protein
VYGYKSYAAYNANGFQYPTTPGLANSAGLYHVDEFRVNNEVIPESASSAVRWKDVVFEKWSTISVRSNQQTTLQSAGSTEIFNTNEQRTYEVFGNAGRHFYSYTADTIGHVLDLQNRSNAADRISLNYGRPDESTIVLFGLDSNQDSLYVVLSRIDKKYLLKEAAKNGRRKGLRL